VSLENLLKIGQLKPNPPDAAEIERLMTTAEHCIAEAGRLIEDVVAWRKSERPDLLPQKKK
jgi:hypothetical protein